MKYLVRIQGELGQEWAHWFGGAAISRKDAGVTLLTCDVPDQAASYEFYSTALYQKDLQEPSG